MGSMDSLPNRPTPSRPISEVVVAWLQWFGVVRLVVTVMAVVCVGAGGFWLLRAPAAPVESTLPYAATTTAAAIASTDSSNHGEPAPGPDAGAADPTQSSEAGAGVGVPSPLPTSPATIVVYVAGAVIVPGVYELPTGARVQQAVLAAGGVTADADADAINLAAFVDDGDRIFMPRIGQPVPTVVAPTGGGGPGPGPLPAGTSVAAGPLDLNDATADQLDGLPGVGPATAAAIVAHRETNGPFVSVEALLDVRGIGPAKLDAIRTLITV